jgi:hypothetical protein
MSHKTAYLRCHCPHCEQSIEYGQDMMTQTVSCPSCSGEMTLPTQEVQNSEVKSGFFSSLIEKYKAFETSRANRNAFLDELFIAVADGILTEDELMAITERREELGLTTQFLRDNAKKLLEAATESVVHEGICKPESQQSLQWMAEHLGVQFEQFSELSKQVRRAVYKYRLRHEPLAPISVPNVVLEPGESAFWSQPASLYENKVVRRRYEGGSRGVSIRVAKGVSFRVGNHRGQSVSETADVPVAFGEFIITSHRLLFVGDKKSFSAPLKKVLHLEPAHDGVRFSETNRQKPRLVLFQSHNGDLAYEVLQRIV